MAKKKARGVSRRPSRRGTTGTKTPARRVSKATSRVKATERAVKTLGEGRLKPGSIKVSSSNYVTPTRRGFGSRSVSRTIKQIASTKAVTYSYSVKVRFRGKDGRIRAEKIEGLGVPRLKDAARVRRTIKGKGGKKRKETAKEALNRLIRDEARRYALGEVRKEWGSYTDPNTGRSKLRKMSKEKAARFLSKMKSERSAKIKIEFHRVVRAKR